MIVQEYAIKVAIEGSQVVVKELKKVQKEEENLNKATKTDIANTNKRNKELKETNSLLWTYAKRLVGVYAIYKMFRKGIDLALNFTEQGTQLRNLSVGANVSARSLQKWGYAVKKFGGSESTIAGTMGSLNKKLYEYRNYGVGHFDDYAKRYGSIPAGNTAEEFLLNVAKKMEGYTDKNAKLNIADVLGLDMATTEFLMQGYKKVKEELNNAIVNFSDEDIKKATEAKEKLIELNKQLERLGVVVGGIVLDPLIDTLKELVEFLKDPKKYLFDKENGAVKKTIDIVKDSFNPYNFFKRLTDYSSADSTRGTAKGLINGLGANVFGKSNWNTAKGFGNEFLSPLLSYGDFMTRYNPFTGVGGLIDSNNSNITVNNSVKMEVNGSNAQENATMIKQGIENISNDSINQADIRK